MNTLVLLPGMDGTGDLFRDLIAAMGSRVPVEAGSYPTTQDLTTAQLERCAEDLLLRFDSVVLLGESFSGPIAISLAAKHGARVKGLVLCGTFARTPIPMARLLQALVRFIPSVILGAPFIARCLSRSLSSRLRLDFVAALAKVSPAVLRSRLSAVLAVDVTAELARITAPIMILTGTRDRVVPPRATELLRRIQPTARVVALEGPHWILQVRPGEAADAIVEFVSRIEEFGDWSPHPS